MTKNPSKQEQPPSARPVPVVPTPRPARSCSTYLCSFSAMLTTVCCSFSRARPSSAQISFSSGPSGIATAPPASSSLIRLSRLAQWRASTIEGGGAYSEYYSHLERTRNHFHHDHNTSLTDATTVASTTTQTKPGTPAHKKSHIFPKLWARNHFFCIFTNVPPSKHSPLRPPPTTNHKPAPVHVVPTSAPSPPCSPPPAAPFPAPAPVPRRSLSTPVLMESPPPPPPTP